MKLLGESARRSRLAGGALVACTVLALAGAAAAATPAEVAADVSAQVMSPFCPGLTLHDCPSEAATDLRVRIERWARRGRSEGEILARLRAEYGPSILGAPEPRGAGLVAWLLPVAGVVAGAAAVAVLARRWSSPPVGPLETDEGRRQPSPEERARLDAELAALREQA
jgi:cytochrome c-type biogenesis protein CcmH